MVWQALTCCGADLLWCMVSQVHIKGDGDDEFWATSAQDVACWLPDVLLCPTSRNAQINLVGEVLTWNKAIRIFEEAAGKQPKSQDIAHHTVLPKGFYWLVI